MPRKLCFIESALAWVRLEVLRSSRSSAAFSSATCGCTSLFQSDVPRTDSAQALGNSSTHAVETRVRRLLLVRVRTSASCWVLVRWCAQGRMLMLSFTASSRSYCYSLLVIRRYAFASRCSPLSARCLTGKAPSASARTITPRGTRSCLSQRVYRLRRNRVSNAAVRDKVAVLAG